MEEPLVVADPKIMAGKPVIRGTRITVELILEKLAAGQTVEQVLKDYPYITWEGIRAALEFAAESVSFERMYPVDRALTETLQEQSLSYDWDKRIGELTPTKENAREKHVETKPNNIERRISMEEPLIEADPRIMVGKPVIKGTRITVEHVLEELANGLTVEQILREYPHLTREGVQAALRFAAKSVSYERAYPADRASA